MKGHGDNYSQMKQSMMDIKAHANKDLKPWA